MGRAEHRCDRTEMLASTSPLDVSNLTRRFWLPGLFFARATNIRQRTSVDARRQRLPSPTAASHRRAIERRAARPPAIV